MVAGFVDSDTEFEIGFSRSKEYFLGKSMMEDVVCKLEAECFLQIDKI